MKGEQMNEEELFLEWLKSNNLDDADESEYDYWRNSAQFQSYLLVYYFNELGISLAESVRTFVNQIATAGRKFLESLNDIGELPRPPVEIKKEIKHEKNPMRLKQLNRELNESYKVYGKKRKGEQHE
jgi:hypothetical protein